MKKISTLVLATALMGVVGLSALVARPTALAADRADDKDKVAKIGDTAPDFTLTDTDGKTVKLAEIGKDKIVVLEWFNPGCPFVKKHHVTFDMMTKTATDYKDKGVVWVAINSGGAGKEGASKEDNVKAKKDWKMDYPILLDDTGATGKAYGAKTTPHMFIIGKDGKLVYKGGLDNNSSADKLGDKNYVKTALDEIIAGKKVTEAETRSYGCPVKYSK
jgi:peroxiredoxin